MSHAMQRFDDMISMAVLATTAFLSTQAHAGPPSYELSWSTIDGGGGVSSDAAYEVAGTIGQPDAGVLTGGGYSLTGGFLAGVVPTPAPCDGDVNGDLVVDVVDLVLVITAWGTDDASADFDPPGGDGIVDVQDLVALILAWGPCP